MCWDRLWVGRVWCEGLGWEQHWRHGVRTLPISPLEFVTGVNSWLFWAGLIPLITMVSTSLVYYNVLYVIIEKVQFRYGKGTTGFFWTISLGDNHKEQKCSAEKENILVTFKV